jgi:hypothetical protein
LRNQRRSKVERVMAEERRGGEGEDVSILPGKRTICEMHYGRPPSGGQPSSMM